MEIKRAKGVKKEEHPTYNTVIVDEAARVNPGDLMIPLAQAERRIILVGDHRQLPHIYDEEIFENLQTNGSVDNENDIKVTLFQYLMKNAKKLYDKDGIPRTITLDAQYRMHPLLGKFVSENFYKKYGEEFKSPLDASFFEQHLYEKPLVWVDVNHESGKAKKRGTSSFRECEAEYIAEAIKKCMNSEEGKNLSYGVISFYSAQVKEIQNKLGRLAEKVRVGSVDAFQGMEFDVIFLSVVRTHSKIPNVNWELLSKDSSENAYDMQRIEQKKYIADVGQGIYGFLTSENRLCVSLSRQKKIAHSRWK
jgi:superfamily I DNA and/or RNA helicase